MLVHNHRNSKYSSSVCRGESGFSLLETIVAVGLTSIIATSAVTVYFNKSRTLEKAKIAGEKTDLRAYLRQTINCPSTLSAGGCSDELSYTRPKLCTGKFFGSGSADEPQNGFMIGEDRIRIKCGSTLGSNKLFLERYNPIRQRWEDLSEGMPLVCSPGLAAGGASFAIVRETVNPQPTDIHVIVDDSFSMTAIQAKTADSLGRLVDLVVASGAEVAFHVYTTTLFSASIATSVFINGMSYRPFQQMHNQVAGGVIASMFGGNNPFVKGSLGFKQPLRVLNVSTGQALPYSTDYVIGSGEIIEFAGDLKAEPVAAPLVFDSSTAAAGTNDANKSALKNLVASLGTGGSDQEAPLAVLDYIADDINPAANRRFAAWIISNEDDRSMVKARNMYSAASIVDSRWTLVYYLLNKYTSITWQRVGLPVYTDGVLTDAGGTQTHKSSIGIPACSGGCPTRETPPRPCSPEELVYANDRLSTLLNQNPWWNATPIYHTPDSCQVLVHQVGQTRTADSQYPDCDTDTGSGSFRTMMRQSFQGNDSAHLLTGDEECMVDTVPAYPTYHSSRIEGGTVYPPSLPEDINTKLKQKLGPRGYSIGLIGNNGTSCGQGPETISPERLGQLMASSPTPELSKSLCDTNYDALAAEINRFASNPPKERYPIQGMRGDEIHRITIRVVGSTTDTLLDPSTYTISNNHIEFDEGIVRVGDIITLHRQSSPSPQNQPPPEGEGEADGGIVKCSN